MVNKNPLSEEQKEAIQDFIADPKRKLGAFKEYIENLEQMMANGELPNTYLAFEIIENIMGGLEEGYSNDEMLSALSDKLQDNYIKVPSVAEPVVKSRVTVLPIAIPCFVIVTVIVVDDDCE